MTDTMATTSSTTKPMILGPFLGHVTTDSIKIWLHLEGSHADVSVTLHPEKLDAAAVADSTLTLRAEDLFTDCVTVEGLKADTKYFYKLWTDPEHKIPLPLDGLTDRDLYFWTLSDDRAEQIDFLVMSCHNPDVSTADGYDGYAVWADLPQIIARESNDKIRFALLVGDQVYADQWTERVLTEENEQRRLSYFVEVYRHYWSNIYYRRVMCSLPAVMIWDDHDITDGWGSELKSFIGDGSEFQPQWRNLFAAASKTFSAMQASRNPEPLAENPIENGYDFCFQLGEWGFVFLDLRTNRNLRLNQLHTDEQFERVRRWVEDNLQKMHTLFVISPVVLSHGNPEIDDLAVKWWPQVMRFVEWVGWMPLGKGLRRKFWDSIGDIRDDIRDSWGARENARQTDRLLDFLFGLQNHLVDPERRVGVVIVSGDIHTSGYANIYSSDQEHAGSSSIPHITSSTVAYTPFNWLLEAVYRFASKAVALGERGAYSSQISHHFCSRSVAVFSLRRTGSGEGRLLKVKYYLEGFPEPTTLIFDLEQVSHSENITWLSQNNISEKKYAPTSYLDVEALLALRAKEIGTPLGSTQPLNYKESVHDLMVLLGLDDDGKTREVRKKMAQRWGYTGEIGSRDMNIWLMKQIKKRIRESGAIDKFLDNI